MEKISSTQNKLIKSIKKMISDKKYRDATNCFVAESFRVINTLIKNKVTCRNLIITSHSKYKGMIREWTKLGLFINEVSDQVFESLSSLANSDGVLGVFNKPKLSFEIKKNQKYLVLDRIQNPGNLGTIIRTAVAFNTNGIIITNDSVDIYHPQIIRSSMGAIFSIPLKVSTSLQDTINNFKKLGIKTYATLLNNTAKELNQITFEPSSAVIFGNEGNGLSDKDVKLCDESIYVKISNNVDSLNVSTAVAIVLHKMSN